MPDAEGRPLFSDFPDADSVARALDVSPVEWRGKLLIWQYALMRAGRLGRPRPGAPDIVRLTSRIAAARPSLMAVNAVLYGAAGIVSVSIVAKLPRPNAVMWAIVLVTGIGLWLTAIHPLNRRGRAMRLVWAAREASPDDAREMLAEALELDLPRV